MLLLFTLAVPPVTAFLLESGLDFEKGCYVSYIKKNAIGCFASTLGRCFDRYFREKSVILDTSSRWGQRSRPSSTSAAKVSDQESAAKLERSARASSSEPVAEELRRVTKSMKSGAQPTMMSAQRGRYKRVLSCGARRHLSQSL